LALFEENAKKNKIGLWIENNPIEPSEWRKK
jgi:endonuclease YncB( thermonuclease family)